MANKELEEINRQIAALKRERKALEDLRSAKAEAFRMKFGNLPARFATAHPIATELAVSAARAPITVGNAIARYAQEEHPVLAKIGSGLRARIARVQSNTQFSKGLQPGQEALNPQTDQFVRRSDDGYSYTARSRKKINV